jgi:2-keto-4-pentenoate hydratase/2-oxohepta-3-ene-1,7-dioic acid hydratase in catechol pathway
MKFARFDDTRLGLVAGDELIDVTAALDQLPALRWPYPYGDPLLRHLPAIRAAAAELAASGARIALDRLALNSPVALPSKIIAAPVNYKKHLDESRADKGINYGAHVKTIDELGLFLKASTSLVGPGEGVKLWWTDRRIDHELELAVIIGDEGRDIPAEQAMQYVAGYSMGLDMSVRGTEDRSFRKSFDSFTVLGPWLVTADELGDPNSLDFRLTVNGEVRQQSNTELLIWNIPKLIEYASSCYTLYPGDIILSGTPEGVAPVQPGDVMECWFEGIGTMSVPVY